MPRGLAPDGERSWTWIELTLPTLYCFATVNILPIDDDETVYVRHLWFTHIDSVIDVVRQAEDPENRWELARLDLFSPGHVNGQGAYKFDQLKEIWCHPEGSRGLRFVLADGRTFFFSPCGDLCSEEELELIVAL